MNFVMSYKTANDLIYGQTVKRKSNMSLTEDDSIILDAPPSKMETKPTVLKLSPLAKA